MAPTAPRPTPHKDALLDRTGIIGASGHRPPPTPGMNRSGAAGFMAFVVMVFAAVTGVSELERGGDGSRLIAGDKVAEEAVPRLSEGAGLAEQRRDNLIMGVAGDTSDEPAADAESTADAGPTAEERAGARPATDVEPATPGTDVVPAETPDVDVPANGAQADGLGERVPEVAQADTARQSPRIARTRTSDREQASLHRRIQLFGEELRHSVRNHSVRNHSIRNHSIRNHAVDNHTVDHGADSRVEDGAVEGHGFEGHGFEGHSAEGHGAGERRGDDSRVKPGLTEPGGVEGLYDRVLGGVPVHESALRAPADARIPEREAQREQADGERDEREQVEVRPGAGDPDGGEASPAAPDHEAPAPDTTERGDADRVAGVSPSGAAESLTHDGSWSGDHAYEYGFGRAAAGQAEGHRTDGGTGNGGTDDGGLRDRAGVDEFGTYGAGW
ncbi:MULTISPECIES: hypothetical protein [Prauserella salsuginis group]|uniref:Uncharacterized protein n=1 Tax=Prauserella salsuginis TaxID=387889 RepID=A0ABW6FYQ9_9PSEU|nr:MULTISPECIES: hypothetical protein [Prauserella salsuginis group]MCR3720189.1 hypothetical protein [Prauserella flava]MCR3734102.1 hypothetical protein [Prauserella salsuginis]